MKRFNVLLILLLLPLVGAQEIINAEEFPSFLSSQNSEIDQNPLQGIFAPLLEPLKFLVGGIFGLYVILVVVRVYYERKKVKILKDIRFDLDQLNNHFGAKNSTSRKNILHRIWSKLNGERGKK